MAEIAGLIWAACAVLSIPDGDTLKARCPGQGPVTVRLYCIDAPEMQQRGWGKHSRDALRDMIGRGPIKIIRHSQDKYGRTVGQIIRGRTNINLQMVKAGQAAVYPHYCDDIQYYMAEALAQKRNRGIWKIRGNHQTPWQFRRNKQNKKGR